MYHTETINGHTFRLRYLPGGIFSMGDPEDRSIFKATPVHKVELSAFYIGEFLVTQALWKAVMKANHNPSLFEGDKRPVEQVSWLDIMEGNQDENGQPAFMDRINELTKDTRPNGYHYTLPSEAQWEYVARAERDYEYAGSDSLKEVAWYILNSHHETKEVGLLAPNCFGSYDMSGNVYEWCLDYMDLGYYQECADKGIVKNPVNFEEGWWCVLRGGSWVVDTKGCNVFTRSCEPATSRSDEIGFRLVLSADHRALDRSLWNGVDRIREAPFKIGIE